MRTFKRSAWQQQPCSNRSAAPLTVSPFRDPRALTLGAGFLEQGRQDALLPRQGISSCGLRAKIDGNGFAPEPVIARIADELPLDGEIVWIRNDRAGIGFGNRAREALRRLNRKPRQSRRRSVPRITAAARAVIRINGRTIAAQLCDISSFSARLRTKGDLVPNRPRHRGTSRHAFNQHLCPVERQRRIGARFRHPDPDAGHRPLARWPVAGKRLIFPPWLGRLVCWGGIVATMRSPFQSSQ